MKSEAESLIKKCESEIEELKESFGIFGVNILTGVEPVNITYPINEYPQKIFSYNLDKEPLIQDKLLGIKGQYLIFENGVINLRKFSGYEVRLSC
jgi:Na+-transporting NADH:ubiquinone oxidoreductase subunit NqrA